ncbi:cytochrome P450 [Mycobacterium uberis]|uniref:cytochrome P450 n=1 Tax=Mycobacterium uberis TaxID=2162698 RepID=UPI000E30A3E8|nr:cytochrome P450 [Mycobacterium uberis]
MSATLSTLAAVTAIAGPHDDMLDIMLHSIGSDTDDQLDTDNVINSIFTLLVAGSETLANTIAFALRYLSANPGIAA